MGGLSRVWNFMTRTQPNPTHYQRKFCNPIHQALKTNPIRRVGLGQVGFGGLAAHP